MMTSRTQFREYDPEQTLLLPPDLHDWLPPEDLVYFIQDVVRSLDLGAVYGDYDGSRGGQPAYSPQLMVTLLLYAYCVGVPSSRQIERATYERVTFRVLTADQHPDHDTVAEFRRRHLAALAQLFVQVLGMCRKAGLVQLGHVVLDGTKMQANASKHKAMSYGRMEQKVVELEAEVARLLAEAEATDAEEDARYGRGRRGDELPAELRFRQGRLKKLREARAALEEEARQEAVAQAEVRRQAAEAPGTPVSGAEPEEQSVPLAAVRPAAKTQRNFTDPDSRIMPVQGGKSFVQGYNCQVAVDGTAQVIVASTVTVATNDVQQLEPVLEQTARNLGEQWRPRAVSADAGYFSAQNVAWLEERRIAGYIPPKRKVGSGAEQVAPRGRPPTGLTVGERMERKLRTVKGRRMYAKRKGIVEPVFGQIKQARGFRQFLLRGKAKVAAEWDLICTTHNLGKLYRSGYHPQPA